jgi:NifU-like protein involved in Fe-S cluster formation
VSPDPYNALVRECFANTLHAGDARDGASAYFNDQGLRIRLSACIENDTIAELRFRAWGCPHVLAAAEYFCRKYQERPVADLEQFNTAQIMDDLAVPIEKTGRILVLEDTVRSLRAAISDRQAAHSQD